MSSGSNGIAGSASFGVIVVLGAILGIAIPCQAAICTTSKAPQLDGVFSGRQCVTTLTNGKETVYTGVYKSFTNAEQLQGQITQTTNNRDNSSRTHKQGDLSGPSIAMTISSDSTTLSTGVVVSNETRTGTQTLDSGEKFRGQIRTERSINGDVRISKQGDLSGPSIAMSITSDSTTLSTGVVVSNETRTGTQTLDSGEKFRGQIRTERSINGDVRISKQGDLSGPSIAMSITSDATTLTTGVVVSTETRAGTQTLDSGEKFRGQIRTERSINGDVRISKQGDLSGPSIAMSITSDATTLPTGVVVSTETRAGTQTLDSGEKFRGQIRTERSIHGDVRIIKQGDFSGPRVSATLNSDMTISPNGTLNGQASMSGTWIFGTRTVRGTLRVSISNGVVTVQDDRA